MPKERLLVMDACTVITLHELNLWDAICAKFKVVITETVKTEADFYFDGDNIAVPIELGAEIEVVAVSSKEVADFRARFTAAYQAKLDPGETESLVLLLASEDGKICSADAIVYKVLGCLGEGDQCVSLEGLLRDAGLARKTSRTRRPHGCNPARKSWRPRFQRANGPEMNREVPTIEGGSR